MPANTQIIQAKVYKTRNDLEKFVAQSFSLDAEKKDAEIVGTVAELKLLHLSPRNTFYGIKVKATDYKPKESVRPPNRGEVHAFGINKVP